MKREGHNLLITTLALASLWASAGTSYGQSPQPIFFFHSYLGRCLDFGSAQQPGAPVVMADCTDSATQQIRIVEVDNQHHVLLYAGSLVIGVRNPQPIVGPEAGLTGVAAAPSVFALELEHKAPLISPIPVKQVFALDGDSIILASDRTMVVQVENNHAADGTRLILAKRELKDSEFWRFSHLNYSDAQPTTGFVHISQDPSGSPDAFINAVQNATEGTVIVLDPDVDITLDGTLPLSITKDDVTIRGDRSGVNLGPRIRISSQTNADGTMFDAVGHYTRFTGLRLQGPSRSTATEPLWIGVLAHDSSPCIIDHNDISDWTNAAIEPSNQNGPVSQAIPPDRPQTILIVRNFIHHNERHDYGYGIASSDGSFPFIEGNTFIENRHAVTGDVSEHVGYRARYNLVQSAAPEYVKDYGLKHEYDQDFDMHGSGSGDSDWPWSPCYGVSHCGGTAGDYTEIFGNTFLGTNRLNFFLRGKPSYLAIFSSNVVEQLEPFAIKNAGPADKLLITNNYFLAPNPTRKLSVGDFDGDGVQDLFLATGRAWYYSPAGKAEWRFLSPKFDKVENLLFGDFDGDGRTDVITKYGNNLMVSWGGISDWQTLNTTGAAISDLATGDFDDDGRTDIFYADGRNWLVSSGGTGAFNIVQTSSFRVKDLRFGDVDGDHKTDVFGVEAGRWHVSYSATSAWTPLPVSLTSSVSGLVLADFDGDGRADIGDSSQIFAIGWKWKFSGGGATDWTYRTPASSSVWTAPLSAGAAIGFFDTMSGADILLWGSTLGSNHISIVSGGSLQGAAPQVPQSRQDMR